jgi:hypothetical protein
LNKIIKYGLIVSGMLLLAFIPERLVFQDQIPVCIFRHFTGIKCPFCGMTRACFNIMHLQFLSALRYNPVSMMLPIMLVTEVAYDLFPSTRSGKFRRVVIILFVAGLAVLFVVRILQYFMPG